MSRIDLLWVGLKLLGVYLLVWGLGHGGYALYQLIHLGLRAPESFDSVGDYWRIETYRTLIQAGIYFISGLVLLLGTNLFVHRPRQENMQELA